MDEESRLFDKTRHIDSSSASGGFKSDTYYPFSANSFRDLSRSLLFSGNLMEVIEKVQVVSLLNLPILPPGCGRVAFDSLSSAS